MLFSPTIAYLLTVLLVPDPSEEGLDLKPHFYGNHRWFFVLAALLPIIDSVDTLLKGWTHFLSQGSIYIITILLLFGLNVIAARIRDEIFHAFFCNIFSSIYSDFHCNQSTNVGVVSPTVITLLSSSRYRGSAALRYGGEAKLGKFLASQDIQSLE